LVSDPAVIFERFLFLSIFIDIQGLASCLKKAGNYTDPVVQGGVLKRSKPKIMSNRLKMIVLGLFIFFQETVAFAIPAAAAKFCAEKSSAFECVSGQSKCEACHTSYPSLNVYGTAIKSNLTTNAGYNVSNFTDYIDGAILGIDSQDNDSDSFDNSTELSSGSKPYDKNSVPVNNSSERKYDFKFALKRASISFCGRSPSYSEMKGISASSDPKSIIHSKVTECLATDYWKNIALHRLADKKIKPVKAIGAQGTIVIADYTWDYRLFSYILTGDRDSRDLLLADYHIEPNGTKTNRQIPFADPVNGPFPAGAAVIDAGQPLVAARRAGMITTQWFFALNSMFTAIPRVTAAQAYRSYLDLDIAKNQGLFSVPETLVDHDNKGVAGAACAVCHVSLDPITYPFIPYAGIRGNRESGTYQPTRQFSNLEASGYVLGQPVTNLLEWANKAANSEEFKGMLVRMFVEHSIGQSVQADNPEFIELRSSLVGDGYSVNKLIHRIVDTQTFGAP